MHVNPSLDYVWTEFSRDIIKEINRLAKKLDRRVTPPVSKDDVILFSLGSWPLSFGTLRPYKKNLNSLFQTLNRIKQNPKFSNLRLVFWTPPSVPEGPEFLVRMRMRSAFDVGAMTSYIRQQMKKLKIEVLDMFNPTNIRNEENVCNAHYLCRRPVSRMENLVGEVGLSFLNNLATLVCEA